MSQRRLWDSLGWVLLVLVALLALHQLKLPRHTFLQRSLVDFGHMPLFVVIELGLFGLARKLVGVRSLQDRRPYVLSGLAAIVLAVGTEAIQFIGPRDADPWDVLRDLAGVATMIALLLFFDRGFGGSPTRKRSLRAILLAMVVALLIASLSPTLIWAAAYGQRSRRLPLVCGFESVWEMKFVSTLHASIVAVPVPPDWTEAVGARVGKLTFWQTRYPTLVFEEPHPDWSGFQTFRFQIYSELPEAVTLAVRIHDAQHNFVPSDRFNRRFRVPPGASSVEVDLEEVRRSPATREMDMTSIRSVMIFAIDPVEPITVYVDEVRLGTR